MVTPKRGALVALLVSLSLPSLASADGLPSVGGGARPGPDALYAPPPSSVPQLENVAPWAAPPILISGGQAYRDGEWLYQDFLFDDHGAAGGVVDPNDPHGASSNLFSPTDGSVTYPTDPGFHDNAADLVELRVKPLADATAFRVTVNSLSDPEQTGFVLALGSSPDARTWPHEAGATSPAAVFVTVHGTTAELRDAATNQVVAGGASATVDSTRRQYDVRVPHVAWDPGTAVQRVEIGTGLWRTDLDAFSAPGEGAATANTPGGGSPAASRLFNVGPRPDEPFPTAANALGNTLVDAAAGAKAIGGWWRERSQALALATRDVSAFAAQVDFAKLAAKVDDDAGVRTSGPISRILASRYVTGQGEDPTAVCFELTNMGGAAGAKCEGRLRGQLQPYVVYVPQKAPPASGYGMTLLLHSLSANYNQYASSKNQFQLGDRGTGSLVLTPAGRGPDGFYAGIPEADTFEAWADVARHYKLDPELTDVSGYSMGGFGTFRLLARWPDLFARGFAVVGAPGAVADQLASLRNTPLLSWNGDRDELVNANTTLGTIQSLTDARVRFVEDLFTNSGHLTLATNDEYTPGAAFLADHRVDRDPPHVTYVLDAKEDSRDAVGDHAYWLSGLKAKDPTKAATIDVRSEGFGVGDAPVGDVTGGGGTLTGGQKGALAYVEQRRDWGKEPSAPKADVLHVGSDGVSAVTVDTARARVSCAPKVEMTGDAALTLACPTVVPSPGPGGRCATTIRLRLPQVKGRRVVSVVASRRGRRLASRRGNGLRVVSVKRVGRGAFSVRLTLKVRAKGGKRSRLVVTRRVAACG